MTTTVAATKPVATGAKRIGLGPSLCWLRRPLLAAAPALAALLVWSDAAAQPGPPPRRSRYAVIGPQDAGELVGPRRSLRQRVGVEAAEQLLIAADPDDRIRGVERLAVAGTDEAIKALADGMSPGSAVRTNPRTRLAAVRALAGFVDEDFVRSVLVSVLNSVRAGAPETALDTHVRATAAMALAKAGTKEALSPLVTAVIGRGRTGELARRAILAYPPAELGPLGRSLKNLSPAIIALLGDLGDPRVIGILRKQLKRKSKNAQRAAAVALAKLGDGTPLERARAWMKGGGAKSADDEAGDKDKKDNKDKKEEAGAGKVNNKHGDAALRVAATEVLVLLDTPDAPRALAGLLGDAKTRGAGLRLAERSLSPALVPTLKAVIAAKVTAAERSRAALILTKIGGDAAAGALLGLLAKPELATTAAFGLASSSGGKAASGLEQALAAAPGGAAKRMVMRAGVVRFVKLGERIAGLEGALESALASKDAADRAVGAFGLAVLGSRSMEELLASKQPEVGQAAARAALALGPRAYGELGERLRREATGAVPSSAAIAAGPALLIAPGGNVATSQLAVWAEDGGVLAPLAALRLATRDSRLFRSRLEPLLAGTDPLVRLHVVLGLARSPEKDAVSLLVGAYRFEPDPLIRRALVRALSVRSEKRRIATLELARDLDPDDRVRALARSALGGRKLRLRLPPNGKEVAWISLRANSDANKASAAMRGAQLIREDGLSLPVVTAPDGVLLVPGLADTGSVSVRLAVGADSGEP